MRKNYKRALAFILTLLLVFGSIGVVFADTSSQFHNNQGFNITNITIKTADNNFPLSKVNENNNNLWSKDDLKIQVKASIEWIDITIDGVIYHYLPSDIGPDHRFPIRHSNEGEGSGTINFWLNSLPTDYYGSLSVDKVVTNGLTRDMDVKFNFSAYQGATASGDSIDFSLSANDKPWVKINLTPGAYTIVEAPYPGFTPEQPFHTVYVTSKNTESVVFTNNKDEVATNPSIDVIKTVSPGSITAGNSVEYSITVTNDGNVTLSGVQLSDPMFNGDTYTELLWPIQVGALTPSQSITYNVEYLVPITSTGSITNTVEASGSYEQQTVTATSAATFMSIEPGGNTEHPGIQITKAVSPNAITIGDTVDYYITVTNNGDVTLTNITVSDPLFSSIAEWPKTIDSLAPGATWGAIQSYTVAGDNLGNSLTNTATAATEYDDVPYNVTASAVLNINYPAPSIDVSKSVSPGSQVRGGTVTYTIVVKNNGNADLFNVLVSDPKFNETTQSDIDWPILITELDKGATKTFTATYKVPTDADIGSTISNTVNVSGHTGREGGKEVTDSAIADFTVISSGTSGGGGGTTRHNTPDVIVETAPPLVEIPEIVIPEAEIPKTGGLGIMAFMALGGIITAAGATLRKK